MLDKAPGCEFEAVCDDCGEIMPLESSFQESIEILKCEGWGMKKVGDEWMHYCPECKKQQNQGENTMKSELLHTPVGSVKFPKTVVNDQEYRSLFVPPGYDQNDKSNVSTWSFTLVLNPKDAAVKKLLDHLDAEHKNIKGAKFKPYKADKSKNEDGNLVDTGLIAINFKSSFPPGFVDARKVKVEGVSVGWGSKVKVAFVTKPVNHKSKVGLGRYVKGIQIIELAQMQSDYGFDEEEGGYGAEEPVGANAGGAKEVWDE